VNDIETRYGQFQVPGAEGDLIERFLRRYGEWARNEVRFVAGALQPGPVRVLDIGAFVGTFGIALSQERTIGSLVLVEANAQITPALRENVRRNARAPALVLEALMAPPHTDVAGTFEEGNLGSLSFAAVSSTVGRTTAALPTKRMSLIDLRREQGHFDLIKMDVEGLECAILAADPEILRSGASSFWLECNDAPISLDLADLLLSAGLRVHYFAFPAFASDNFRGDPEPIFPFAFEAGLWASRAPAPLLPTILARQGCMLRPIRCREDLRRALWSTPRWGRPEWRDASVHAMVAEAAHALHGENYSTFLVPPRPAPSDRDALASGLQHAEDLLRQERENVMALQKLLEETRTELRATQIILNDEGIRLTNLQGSVQAQKSIAAGHVALAAQANSRAEAAERVIAALTNQIAAMEGTGISRGRLMRAFRVGHPEIRRLLRFAIFKVRQLHGWKRH
jgi:FkbM family methyltransferase